MKPVIWMLIVALLAPAPALAVDYSPVTGVWRAQMFGVPAFVLTISDEGDEFTGAILFYSLRHEADGKNARATPGTPEPLFGMKFDGQVLEFQVSHRRAHGARTAKDAPVRFRLRVTGPGSAEMVGGGNAAEPPLKLTRDQ